MPYKMLWPGSFFSQAFWVLHPSCTDKEQDFFHLLILVYTLIWLSMLHQMNSRFCSLLTCTPALQQHEIWMKNTTNKEEQTNVLSNLAVLTCRQLELGWWWNLYWPWVYHTACVSKIQHLEVDLQNNNKEMQKQLSSAPQESLVSNSNLELVRQRKNAAFPPTSILFN